MSAPKRQKVSGLPPLTFKSTGRKLAKYRIYGNTVNGESVGDPVTSGEHSGEYCVPVRVEGKNRLPLPDETITEKIGDILCKYNGRGKFTFISEVEDPSYPEPFIVELAEPYSVPAPVSRGGTGCIQLNNDYSVDDDPPVVFALWNGDLDESIEISCRTDNVVSSNYDDSEITDTVTHIVFLNMDKIGKNKVTFRPAVYLDTTAQEPFEMYHEAVCTNIYLPEQLSKFRTKADHIDYPEQKLVHGAPVLGICVDYENNTVTRIEDAASLSPGTDFDKIRAFGGRKRCNVADDGTIRCFFGDPAYKDDGTNGQVMVYQPAFYYRVEALKTSPNTDSGIGSYLLKANYYVCDYDIRGFKRHPAFFDADGDPVDYILFSAYEGSMYDVSASAYVNDGADTSTDIGTGDLLCSVGGVKPISGLYKDLTITNLELLAQNRGPGWHLDTIQAVSAEQLLMIIESGNVSLKSSIEDGVISVADNGDYNCASITGSTAGLGNATGHADSTVNEIHGTRRTYSVNGKRSISYRGVENPWGNIWKRANGLNIWGDGTMGGGRAFVCSDFDYDPEKREGNYSATDICLSNASGFIKYFGYDPDFDWLFIPSKTNLNISATITKAYHYTMPAADGYKIICGGGSWTSGNDCDVMIFNSANPSNGRNRATGGRLMYVPSAEATTQNDKEIQVSLPAIPTLPGTDTMSVMAQVQPSEIEAEGRIEPISAETEGG